MKIIYDENGLLVSDKKAYETMKSICEEGKDVTIGSDVLILALRLLIVEGIVNPNDVVIEYEGKELRINESGVIKDVPEGFTDASIHMSMQIIRKQSELRRLRLKEKNTEAGFPYA